MSHQKTELNICREVIEIRKEKLKLEQVAVFLSYDHGHTINETYFNGLLPKNSLLELAIDSPHQLAFEASAPLYHHEKIVGHGWNAAMLLRSQGQIIGLLLLDNLINKRPLTSHSKHLLTLFSAHLAEIFARKRAEESSDRLNNELEHLVVQRT